MSVIFNIIDITKPIPFLQQQDQYSQDRDQGWPEVVSRNLETPKKISDVSGNQTDPSFLPWP